MKFVSSLSTVIFSVRTFAAAMLALYLSYQLDLSRPTWAFITTYIVASSPLRGAGRSKSLYRICGTLCGACFIVATLPNLVDAPELLILSVALWIGGCLYLSIIDGTPRAYAFILAGYTTAVIGFPSVNAPDTIFDTAISRTEEIGIAILCVELMSYLPFNQRAGDALHIKMEQCLIETRNLAVSLMTFRPNSLPLIDRAKLMIDVENMNALRIQAHYDTPDFLNIEGWFVRLQRHLRDFFTDLVTFDAQLRSAKIDDAHIAQSLHPFVDSILAWITSGEIAPPPRLSHLLASAGQDRARQGLVKSGILDTLCSIVRRRHECLVLRQKIVTREKMRESYDPVAAYIDYRQAALYGFVIVLQLIIVSTFWIATGWPEGGVMAFMATVIFCFFPSLEAPPNIVTLFLGAVIIGTILGWCYNFLIFPHIDGFPLLVYVLAWSCVPIGICMANPKLGALMLPLILGINSASFENRFQADMPGFLNNFIAIVVGALLAGIMLSFVRGLSFKSSTKHFLTENGQALALLADDAPVVCDHVIDRMTHRSALALIRASQLRADEDQVVSRVLLDIQAGKALAQIKDLMPKMSPDLQDALHTITGKLAHYFAGRKGLHDQASLARADIHEFTQKLNYAAQSYESMQLMGLMQTLDRGIGKEAA